MRPLAASAILCFCGLVFAAEIRATRSAADSLYHAAVARLDSATVDQCMTAFRQVLETDPDYGPAHHRLARLHMSLNTVNDRDRAHDALLKAIGLEPENLEYQLSLGDLLWAMGFFHNARDQYE